jgi:hypothetical protein
LFIIGILLIVAASLIYFGAGTHFQKKMDEKYEIADRDYVKTEGKVVKTIPKIDEETGKKTGYVSLVVEYYTEDGEKLIYHPWISFGNVHFREGSNMPLLYNPKNPSEVLMDLKVARKFPKIFAGSFAGIALIGGLIFMIGDIFMILS